MLFLKDSGSNNHAEVDQDQDLLMMGQVDFCDSQKGAMCFLDSSCNNHMTGDKKWFLHLDDTFR